MTIAQALIPEFDQEMATTRTMLERVPFDRAAWKPHPKSTALGALASHLASLPGMVQAMFAGPEMDMSPPGGKPFVPPQYHSREDLLAAFDGNVRKAHDLLAGASDEMMRGTWTLKFGGHVIVSLPRAALLRSLTISHIIHHRGQLSVYLRLNDVPLPSVYGPTADTQ